MRALLLAAALSACTTTAPSGAVVVFPVPGRSDVSVVSGTREVAVLSAPTGIFQLDLDFSRAKPAKLTLVVLHERSCEGLDFRPPGGAWRGIRKDPGVKVFRRGDDMVVELGAQVLSAMGSGGRLQFVNLYR